MTRGFHERRSWAAKMHERHLSPAMAAYWDVPVDDIQAMHGESAGALSADKTGGIDAIVQSANSAPVFVAQRVRTLRQFRNQLRRPDFSLRVQTATGDDSEFVRLLNAYRTGRDLPSCYLFGITKASDRQSSLEQGLSVLIWIDTFELLASIDTGELQTEPYDCQTGEVTNYYTLEDLRDCDCIIAECSGQTLQSVYDDNRPVDDGFPHASSGVQAGKMRLQDFGGAS